LSSALAAGDWPKRARFNPHEETMGSTRKGSANPIGAALPQHIEIAATAAAAQALMVALG